MNITERTKCAVVGKNDFELLYTFKDFPIFMGCTDKPLNEDITADMVWVISISSGLIQLQKLVPLEILYQERHDSNATKHWIKHHQLFAEFLSNFHPASVFEIGGSYGLLSIEYDKFDSSVDWTIIEPNPAPVEGCKAQYVKGFFNSDFNNTKSYDALIHTNLLEHMYEPDVFMRNISETVKEGKYHIFAHPNMQMMLERKYTNCINFEHTMMLSEPYVDYLLARYGFKIIEKKYVLDNHTIFYATIKDTSIRSIQLPELLYSLNKRIFGEFINYNKTFINNVNALMQEQKKTVFVFGAHVFTQYFIAFGLMENCLAGVLDNDTQKHGKRLYGTSLIVASPRILKDMIEPIVILRAGVHNSAIKSDIIENINAKTTFWE